MDKIDYIQKYEKEHKHIDGTKELINYTDWLIKEIIIKNDKKIKNCICSSCGICKNMKRKPVFLTDNILSFISYEENTCKECGHQISWWTLPFVYDNFILKMAKLKRELNEINKKTSQIKD